MEAELIVIIEALSYVKSANQMNTVILTDLTISLQNWARRTMIFRGTPIAYSYSLLALDNILTLPSLRNKKAQNSSKDSISYRSGG